MILENPDGTYQFFALVKNEGQSYETVDNRKDSTRKQEEQRTQLPLYVPRPVEEPLHNYEPEAPKTEEESIDFEIKF